MRLFRTHGKDWGLLAAALPSKSLAQIKHYFQNYKVKLGLIEVLKQRERMLSEWTYLEKAQFVDLLMEHGKNWDAIAENLETKSRKEVKFYYQNVKITDGLEDILKQRTETIAK